MTNTLILSEDTLKTFSSLNNNIFGKTIAPSIVIAQDIYLQGIIGTNLYRKLLSLIDDGSIERKDNIQYKYLIDTYIIPFLIYQTQSILIEEISAKVTNIGVVHTSDERIENLPQSERELLASKYQNYANFHTGLLQNYLLDNRSNFPELNDNDCSMIKANLYSSTMTTLWLGGFYGKKTH